MIYKLEKVDSTQKYLLKNSENFQTGDAVYALCQTSGYGRTGIWESDESNIYFSVIIDTIKYPSLYTICAMHKFISKYTDQSFIKLPNDLYYKTKKLGGFIIEKHNDKLIIGIGINIYLNEKENYTSLNAISHISKPIDDLVYELYITILSIIKYDIETLNEYFKVNTHIIGKNISFIDKRKNLILNGIVNDLYNDQIIIDNQTYDIYSIKIIL